jgi:inner membrane protease subunit 2
VIKRLVAKEGDVVQNRSGEKLVVPKDHLWIEGDNEEKSLDSNHYGPVHKDLVTGVAKGIVYPLDRISILSRTNDEKRVLIDETTKMNNSKHIFSVFRDLSNF